MKKLAVVMMILVGGCGQIEKISVNVGPSPTPSVAEASDPNSTPIPSVSPQPLSPSPSPKPFQICGLWSPGTLNPCGPFPLGDSFVSDLQGDFYCVLDLDLGQVACSVANGPFMIVQNLVNATQLPYGNEYSFCAQTVNNGTFCWTHTMVASPSN